MTEKLQICMPASAAAARFARTLMERRLTKWGYSHILDDALLVTSELVTNAMKATPGQAIELVCRWSAEAVVIEVWDSSPEPPVPVPPEEVTPVDLAVSEADFDANGGRGLRIVEALTAEWGHRSAPVNPATGLPGGKWVWARIPT